MFYDCLKEIGWKKFGIFAAGVAFGTAGIKILSSKDAKKAYTQGTAAVLRAKECVMKTATTIQEMQKIFTKRQRVSTKPVRQRKEAEVCEEETAEKACQEEAVTE